MKTIFLYILLLGIVQSSYGQIFHRKDGQQRLVILSPGFSMQGGGNFYTELNLMLSKYYEFDEEEGLLCYSGPRIGIETNFSKEQFVCAPKIGWEGSIGFLICFRGNVISYIDNGNVDLRILPEIGLSGLGFFNIVYGYNIPLLEYRSTAITNHRVTLTINIDLDHWRSFGFIL